MGATGTDITRTCRKDATPCIKPKTAAESLHAGRFAPSPSTHWAGGGRLEYRSAAEIPIHAGKSAPSPSAHGAEGRSLEFRSQVKHGSATVDRTDEVTRTVDSCGTDKDRDKDLGTKRTGVTGT